MNSLQLWIWHAADFIRGIYPSQVPAPVLVGLPVLLLGAIALAKR